MLIKTIETKHPLYIVLNEQTGKIAMESNSNQEIDEYLYNHKEDRLVVYGYQRKNFNW